MEFKITTLNLGSEQNGELWKDRVNRLIDYIKENNPLILCTQEGLLKMIDELDSRLDDYDYIGIPGKHGETYCAIFYMKSKVFVKESGTFWLSKTPNIPASRDYQSSCIRICTWGEFVFHKTPNIRFRVYNTQLDKGSNKAKLEGIKLIISKMNQKYQEEKLPTILTGDFNSTPGSEVLNYVEETKLSHHHLMSCFHVTNNESSNDEMNQIDYIYCSYHFNMTKRNIFRKNTHTTHYPITTKLTLDEPKLKNNYHTHNFRCKHALGNVSDYVNEAKKLGMYTIGISCHLPFPDGRIPELRMKYSELDEYLNEIKEAQLNYNDIEILSGFECEYFESLKDYYYEIRKKVDFLILGQHYTETEDKLVSYYDYNSEEALSIYTEHIEKALSTQLFTILAHPDCFGLSYPTFDKHANMMTKRIAETVLKHDVYLELNSNGFRRKNIPYPIDAFWQIIGKEYPEIKIIITADAHLLSHLNDFAIKEAYEFAHKHKLKIVDKILLK